MILYLSKNVVWIYDIFLLFKHRSMFLIIAKLLSKTQLNYLIKGEIVIENKEFILLSF